MKLAEFSTAEEVSCIMNNTAAVETASNEDKKYQVKNYSPIERISAESMVKLAAEVGDDISIVDKEEISSRSTPIQQELPLEPVSNIVEVIAENRYRLNRNHDGDTSDKMARWKAQLAEFDYQVEHAEGDNLVDHQSCLPCNSCLHRNVTSTPVLNGVDKFISTDPLMDLIYSIPPSTTEMLCTTVCYYNPYSEDHPTMDICDNHKRGFEDMYP